MGNPFQAVIANNGFNRHYGGTKEVPTADPYISGYHFIKFVPNQPWMNNVDDLLAMGSGQKASDTLSGNIAKFLEGACLSVTPPGGTLNKTEFVGLGGIKWSVPTNIDYANTVTVKFLEFSYTPVLTIFHAWVRLIRDYRTGTSQLNGGPEDYTKSNYAASMYYWTTKPDGVTVEYSALYSGMFPNKDPQDLFAGDLTAVDKLEVDIEFNVDWVWHENWVHDACQAEAEARKGAEGPSDGATTNEGNDQP